LFFGQLLSRIHWNLKFHLLTIQLVRRKNNQSLFVCSGPRTRQPRDALRANEAKRARQQASSQTSSGHQNAVTEHKTKEYTMAAPILRTWGAMKEMHSLFTFGANSLPRQK
jgi:hypothetical protein